MKKSVTISLQHYGAGNINHSVTTGKHRGGVLLGHRLFFSGRLCGAAGSAGAARRRIIIILAGIWCRLWFGCRLWGSSRFFYIWFGCRLWRGCRFFVRRCRRRKIFFRLFLGQAYKHSRVGIFRQGQGHFFACVRFIKSSVCGISRYAQCATVININSASADIIRNLTAVYCKIAVIQNSACILINICVFHRHSAIVEYGAFAIGQRNADNSTVTDGNGANIGILYCKPTVCKIAVDDRCAATYADKPCKGVFTSRENTPLNHCVFCVYTHDYRIAEISGVIKSKARNPAVTAKRN